MCGQLRRPSARHLGVLARVVPPSDDDADGIEDCKAPQRGIGGARQGDGAAIALGNEEPAVGSHGGREAQRGGAQGVAFLVGLGHGSRVVLVYAAQGLGQEDHRDHAEGGTVANAGGEEQHQEAHEEARELPFVACGGQEHRDAHHGDGHDDEVPQRDARAAELVGQPAAKGADHSAHQRAQPGVGQWVDVGKLALDEQREACCIADERAEGAEVQHAHQPVVLAAEDGGLRSKRGAGVGNVVHAEPCGQGRDGNPWHPDEGGVLRPDLHGLAILHDGLAFATKDAEDAGCDDQRAQELHHRHAQVAQAGIHAQRRALAFLRKEEADVGHAGAEG